MTTTAIMWLNDISSFVVISNLETFLCNMW